MTRTAGSIQDELTRRHRAAVTTVNAMLGLSVLLAVVSLFDLPVSLRSAFEGPVIDGILRITIIFFALGAIAFRRTRFNAMRLQDIASLGGVSALLRTLENTTRLIALLGGVVAVMGFVLVLSSGSRLDLLSIGIGVVVLLYCYPRRAAWERVVSATQAGDEGTPPAKGTFA